MLSKAIPDLAIAMKIDSLTGMIRVTVLLALMVLSFGATRAQSSWEESYQSPPDAVLRFRTDSEGRILPARVFGLANLRGGVFSHSDNRFLMHGDSRAVYKDFTSQRPLVDIETPGSVITTVALSPDDRLLLTGDQTGSFSAWFLDSGYRFLSHEGHGAELTSASFSSDGQSFVTADRQGIFKVWNLKEGPRPILSGDLGSAIKAVKFSTSNQLLLVTGRSIGIRVLNLQTGETVQEWNEEASSLISAEISEDETELFTVHRRNPSRRIWDLNTGNLKQSLPTLNASQNAYLNAEIDRIVTFENTGRMTIYSLSSGQQLDLRHFSIGSTADFSLSPSGDYLFRLQGSGEIYRLDNNQRLARFPDHNGHIGSIAFAPNGRTIASTAAGRPQARILDLQTGQILNTFSRAPTNIGFTPDGRHLFDTRTGALADAATDAPFSNFTPDAVAASVTSDRHLVLRAPEHSPALIIDPSNNKSVAELEDSRGFENALYTFSPDQTLVASLSQRVIKIWQTDSGRLEREIRTATNHHSIQFAPDGQSLITVDPDHGIAAWHPRNLWPSTWLAHEGPAISSIGVGPDGRNSAVGLADGSLSVLDIATGQALLQMSGHESPVTAVQYSPDGRQIVSGDSDGLLKVWPVTEDGLQTIQITRAEGQSLRIAAQGIPLGNQSMAWFKNNRPLDGPETQTHQQLVFPALQAQHAGIYQGKIDADGSLAETVTVALTVLRSSEVALTFDEWASQFPWPANASSQNEDPDEDLLSSLEEYLLGTHPLEFQSDRTLLEINRDSQNGLSLNLMLAPHARNVAVRIDSSHNLTDWTDITPTLTEHKDANGYTQKTARIPAEASTRFFRWQVE